MNNKKSTKTKTIICATCRRPEMGLCRSEHSGHFDRAIATRNLTCN